MKIVEAIEVIDKTWVQKPKGFRVRFEKKSDNEWTTDYSPGEDQALLDSDVVAWRLAWKLYQATLSSDPEFGQGSMANIHVVDDAGNRVKYYATGEFDVFNPLDAE